MENGDRPATKRDLDEVRTGMKAEAVALRSEMKEEAAMLRSEMQHMRDDFIERLDSTETKLLQAFYTYAESNQKRVSAIENESAALKSRLATVEDRLTNLEKRINMPPAA